MSTASMSVSPIYLLCVDNDITVLEGLKKGFEKKPDFSVLTCTTPADALSLISQYQFDAIISDYLLSGMNGIEFLKEVRSQDDPALFILFTSRHPATVAIETLNNGGTYFIQKGDDILVDVQKIEEFIRTSLGNQRMAGLVPDINTRYRSIVEQQPDLLCCFHPEGTCTFANAAYAHFIGRDMSEIVYTNFLAIIPKNERVWIQKLLSGMTAQYPVSYVEHHVLGTTGEPLLFQWSYRAFFNDRGSTSEILAQGRNSSYIVGVEEIISWYSHDTGHGISPQTSTFPDTARIAIADFPGFADQVTHPMFAVDSNGVVIAWNPAIAELTGTDARTIIGQGDHAYSIPIYGEARRMLVDSVLMNASEKDPEPVPGITWDGKTCIGEAEQVTIRGRPMQVRGKATPVFDGKGTLIAAVQSLLVNEDVKQESLFDDIQEDYLGGISGITIRLTGDGLPSEIAGVIGSATGGYGVCVTDRRLLVVHDPDPDTPDHHGMRFGEFIIDKLFGTNVDLHPRSIADLEKIKVFEVWRNNITAIEMKKPPLLAGFVIIKIASGGSYRILVNHSKAFIHLRQLLNMFWPEMIRPVEETDNEELEWLDEIHRLDLVDRLQIEDPFRDIPHEVITIQPSRTTGDHPQT